MTKKVLMFGWEFPPFNAGGLGTACHGLTKGLSNHNAKVTFVIPKGPEEMKEKSHVNLLIAENMEINEEIKIHKVPSLIKGYINSEEYSKTYSEYNKSINFRNNGSNSVYGKNLFEEVFRYAQRASELAKLYDYEIIHAHDWMTYPAGIKAKEISGKPLVIHVHATELDRTGGNPNEYIYKIEKEGMNKADHIICVSNYTKNKVIQHYGISPDKISVVHNAVEFTNYNEEPIKLNDNDKIVLFLGRVTIQKGPDWFLWTAKKVLEHEPNAKFIVAGNGDMMPFLVEKAAELGIHDKFLFTGFLRGEEIDKAYKMANVYVMPSISEPFGITPLEAMRNGTPVIISKQSGVSEVVENALKVDFWDVDEMANKIISILRYDVLEEEMGKNAAKEVMKFNWDEPAKKCLEIYDDVIESKFRNDIISQGLTNIL